MTVRIDSPCHDCQRRYVGYHVDCGEYKDYQAAIDDVRAAIRADHAAREDAVSGVIDREIKARNRRIHRGQLHGMRF